MLNEALVESILNRIPTLTVGVIGDLFLDRYLDIDGALNERSLETRRRAYQVVRVRAQPGAAGTVINNLAALGVGRVVAVSVIGDDGEGYELRQALSRLESVDTGKVFVTPDRRTPTYTKPMLHETGKTPRELNRLDIKNRTPLPAPLEDLVLEALTEIWHQVDALLVLDQVSEAECGVITTRLREELARLGESEPSKFVLADSRERIDLFRSVAVKPNTHELHLAMLVRGVPIVLSSPGLSPVRFKSDEEAVQLFAEPLDRPVFCTTGEAGVYLARREAGELRVSLVPVYPVRGPIDAVGAGDSTSAGIACAVAAGASLEAAAAFGNLVASITIQQLGTTGTASPEQVRRRWREVTGTSERPTRGGRGTPGL